MKCPIFKSEVPRLIKENHSNEWQRISFFIFEATMQENVAILLFKLYSPWKTNFHFIFKLDMSFITTFNQIKHYASKKWIEKTTYFLTLNKESSTIFCLDRIEFTSSKTLFNSSGVSCGYCKDKADWEGVVAEVVVAATTAANWVVVGFISGTFGLKSVYLYIKLIIFNINNY